MNPDQIQPQANDPKKVTELETIASTRTSKIRKANLDEVARGAKASTSNRHNLSETMRIQTELAAREGLERLLKFLDSMQSTSGRARQLRDFARVNEGTHAAKDAKAIADNADWEQSG